ncbi:hypothetical protein LTR86_006183 [Recurvomyces mirabilis]|nr:hypothetical protein LTR86_006183 [Recurvomyces mirabilis]
MRLLNTTTLVFMETHDPPPYAILSHRWGGEEVTYKEFQLAQRPRNMLSPWQASQVSGTRQRAGYNKILRFCDFARSHRVRPRDEDPTTYQWCWVDTCCIDKRSSAELSEAINSMWKWYRQAACCYVYLADVPNVSQQVLFSDTLIMSSWFKRCWTLQEFLAPERIVFLTNDWTPCINIDKGRGGFHCEWIASRDPGYRAWHNLERHNAVHNIAVATKIPMECFTHIDGHRTFSVAQRLSWAADRSATREEDVAYSLLGLFDINMPLLYGEGQKAFVRLQHEIIRSSPDETIFAWRTPAPTNQLGHDMYYDDLTCCSTTSLLAPHPRLFSLSGRLQVNGRRDVPLNITNRGCLLVGGLVYPFCELSPPAGSKPRWYYAVKLYCRDVDDHGKGYDCGIVLAGRGLSDEGPQVAREIFARVRTCDLGYDLAKIAGARFFNVRRGPEAMHLFLPVNLPEAEK